MEVENDDRRLPLADHLAIDDRMVHRCRVDGGIHVRLWSATDRAIALPPLLAARAACPSSRSLADAAGWRLIRRRSGGGMVPQGPDMLNVTLVDADQATMAGAFLRIGEPIRFALESLGIATSYGCVPGSFCDGRYNLVHRGRKVCGLSQWRGAAQEGKAPTLSHAVLLVSGDAREATAVMNGMQRVAGDPARFDAEQVTTLAAARGSPVVAGELRAALRASFAAMLRESRRSLRRPPATGRR